MELEEAIRSRRTHKAYGAQPVDRATLAELLDLARWAPNHHLTNPWRFRVVGPYIVLLAAHGRGLAGYWRTPAVLRSPEGLAALRIGDDERPIALLHLGPARQEQRPPERAPAGDVVSWLD